jgi:signal transduction histidine kinase/tetratricopeptide (TPR) repeat protein
MSIFPHYTLLLAFFMLILSAPFSRKAEAGNIDSLRNAYAKTSGAEKLSSQIALAEALSVLSSDEAMELASAAEKAAIRSQNKEVHTAAQLIQAEIYIAKQELDKAERVFLSASRLAVKYGQHQLNSNAINGLGKVYLRAGRYQDAVHQFKRSMALRNRHGFKKLEALSLNNIGIAYRDIGMLDSARYFFEASHKLAGTILEPAIQADALNNMAGVYWKEGDYSRAIHLYEQSLALRQKLGDALQIARSLTNIGVVYKDISKYSEALDYHKNALALLMEHGSMQDKAHCLNNIGSVFLKLHRPDSAERYYSMALAIRKELKTQQELASSHENLALAHQRAKKFDSAKEHLAEAKKIREQVGNQIAISNTANLIGNLHLEIFEYDKALDNYFSSLAIRQIIGREDLVAQSLNNIGLLYKSLKNFDKALSHFNESLIIYETLESAILLAYQHNIIGGTYWEMGQHGKALHHYSISLEMRRSVGDMRYVAGTLRNIGMVYKDAGEPAKAREAYEQSLLIYRSTSDSIGMAWTLLYMGNIFKDAGQQAKASEYFQDAEKIFAASNDRHGTASLYCNWGEMLIGSRNPGRGAALAKNALSLSATLSDSELLLKCALLLEQHYAASGDYAQAYRYSKLRAAAQDSIAASDVMKRFAEIQINHELEKKNAQIERLAKEAAIDKLKSARLKFALLGLLGLIAASIIAAAAVYKLKMAHANKLQRINDTLTATNDHLKKSEASLALANMSKNKFFTIIAHDLRNPFSSFIGLTAMLIENFSVMSDDKKILFLHNLNTSAHKTFMLLENLLEWSKNETSGIRYSPQSVDIQEIIDDVYDLQKTSAAHQKIYLVSRVPSGTEVYADKNMLTAIVRNLISNAIKFTPENGEVTVGAERSKEGVTLTVSDTGVGIEPRQLPMLFDKFADMHNIGASSKAKGAGLGLALCAEFTEKHHGRIWAESRPGKGSKFHVFFPNP